MATAGEILEAARLFYVNLLKPRVLTSRVDRNKNDYK